MLVVVGDTHSLYNKHTVNYLARLQPEILCFTGDRYHPDGEDLARQLGVPLWGVVGNCDWQVTSPEELVQCWHGLTIFIAHGHKYDVKRTLNNIYFRAGELGAQIVLFGHTHMPLLAMNGNVILLNPGSPSQPRAGVASVGTLEVTEGVLEASLLNIETDQLLKKVTCALEKFLLGDCDPY